MKFVGQNAGFVYLGGGAFLKKETQKISARLETEKLEYLKRIYGTDSITEVLEKVIDEKLTADFCYKRGKRKKLRTPLNSIGSRSRSGTLFKIFPEHDMYIEPFCRTASILFAKNKAKIEVLNDIDGDIMNFWKVLKSNPLGIYNRCSEWLYSEEWFKELREQYVAGKGNSITEDGQTERAALTLYMSLVGYLGLTENPWKYVSVPSKRVNSVAKYRNTLNQLWGVSERLKDVCLLNRDYKKVINKYGAEEKAFILCDPPFYRKRNYYADGDFKLADQRELYRTVKGCRAKVLVLHDYNEVIHRMYISEGVFKAVVIEEYGLFIRKDDSKKLIAYINYQ
jgi:DNA adenine methylase